MQLRRFALLQNDAGKRACRPDQRIHAAADCIVIGQIEDVAAIVRRPAATPENHGRLEATRLHLCENTRPARLVFIKRKISGHGMVPLAGKRLLTLIGLKARSSLNFGTPTVFSGQRMPLRLVWVPWSIGCARPSLLAFNDYLLRNEADFLRITLIIFAVNR
ncbi:hypothetical protein [Rhizobium sp. RCAM05973]|uniref:hypothetical protein n=1 Tax=Rhizobium sp. RCAM05973 TaxID=2994066 RepID=UPI0022EBE7A2|nr:hypothetical protein [Rhizobium sp. RCAM05973]